MAINSSLNLINVTFPLTKGRFCFITNLNNYLQSANIYLSENEFACSLGYWGFHFDNSKEMNVCGRNDDLKTLFQSFKTIYSLTDFTCDSFSKNVSLDFLQKSIKKNIYPLIWIDSYYLEHSIYYNKAHNDAVIVILHADQDNLCFFDNELHTINTDLYFSILKTKKLPPTYYYLTNMNHYNKEQLISKGFTKIVTNFSTDSPYSGHNGIRLFLNHFKQITNKQDVYDVYFQLNRPGGLTISRQMFSELLLELQNNSNWIINRKVIDIYENLANDWRLIANLCFKLSFEYNSTLHNRIADRIENVFLNEKIGHEELKVIISKNTTK